MNKKITTFTILILVLFAALLVAPLGDSQNLEVNIYQITPNSASGPSGSIVNILGTISNPNSSYQIIMGRSIVASGVSEGYYVNANFTVPESPVGRHALILQDVASNRNSTKYFTVSIGYSIDVAQPTVIEGDSITFNVSVTAGSLDVNYYARIDVVFPSGTSYTTNVNLGTINQKGTASAQVSFPSNSFSPSNSAIDYTGTYTIKFNTTLAQSQFIATILDSPVYHRGETAKIHATAYQPNQAATITFSNRDTTIETLHATASAEGIISTTWVIPDNIVIGSYTVKITAQDKQKAVQDQQTFTVPGHQVKVQVTNLAGKVVPDVLVRAKDTATDIVLSAVSGLDGITFFRLENGPFSLTATLKDINIGQSNKVITGEETFTLRCQLTDTIITVKNAAGITIPFVDLDITYNYQGNTNSKNDNINGRTDHTGQFTLTSTLAGATYTVDASLYGQIFNAGNNTFSNPIDQSAAQVVIDCPIQNVSINVSGYNDKAISEARIEFVECTNGLFYSATTNSEGNSATQITFGRYRVRIYSGNALINETTTEIFGNSEQQIRCTLYGIHLSVSVVDFWGSSIPNTKVTLNGPIKTSAITQSNGIATFDNIIGGHMQIITQPPSISEAAQAITVNINEPATVQIKTDKYISIGGLLIQTSTLITISIVFATLFGFTSVEFYRHRKSHSTTPKSIT